MAKIFYTEHEIEDLYKGGVSRLEMNDNIVLTGLAYEKAQKLGMQLVQPNEMPSDAPIRPYIAKETAVNASSYLHLQAPAPATNLSVPADLSARIKNAVLAKLGGQVDPALLDKIIRRVLDQVKV